jgi:Tfp pilus assembly protein PilW
MNRQLWHGGFTMVEVLVSAAITSAIIMALLTASVAMQRSFSATEFHAKAQGDQLRVIDYVTRDLRRASTAIISNNGRKLTVTVPDQTDMTTLQIRTPTVRADGSVVYGATPIEISYFIEGRDFIRAEGGIDRVISSTIDSFTVQQATPKAVRFTLSFVSQYARKRTASEISPTTLTSTVFLRNAR